MMPATIKVKHPSAVGRFLLSPPQFSKPTDTPVLTILLLCWNHERFMERAIGALASQTRRDFDVVFLDNVSNDRSADLAESLLDEADIPYQSIRNCEPASIPFNLNRMLARASSPLVTVQSTDDWLAPRYVEAMVAAAAAEPDTGWFSCGGWIHDETTDAARPVEPDSFGPSKNVLPAMLAGDEPFFFPGHCYRRALLEEIGGWDDDQIIEDADLFLRLALRTRHRIVPEKLFNYRDHAGSASGNPAYMVAAHEKFFAKHESRFPGGIGALLARSYRVHAAVHADRGEGLAAVRLALKAIRRRPFEPINWRTLVYGVRVLLR